VYKARERRITAELGAVPPYATSAQGGPIDVAPSEGRRASSLTAPADPTQVSRREFDEMVANLGVDDAPPPTPAAAGPARPRGGRRARAQGQGDGTPPPAPPTEGGNGGDGEPPREQRKPRNKKHGRPR
jgi:SecD/SecF fusion protein